MGVLNSFQLGSFNVPIFPLTVNFSYFTIKEGDNCTTSERFTKIDVWRALASKMQKRIPSISGGTSRL